jgi:hypothetical protein
MKYLPSPQVQAELIKAGLEQFCNGIDFEDADWNSQRDYFRSHPIHAKESDAEIDDRTGYFLIWRDYGVPQTGKSAEDVTAKRITVMHESLREMAREHFPKMAEDLAAVKESASIQANAGKMLGAQFSKFSTEHVLANLQLRGDVRSLESSIGAKHSEALSVNAVIAGRIEAAIKKLGKIAFWGIVSLALLLLLNAALSLRAHAQGGIDVIQFQDSAGTIVKTFAAPFKIKCSTNLTCTASGSTLTMTAAGGGPGGGYTTLQNATVAIAQESTLNWTAGIVCADNAPSTRSDCALANVAAVSHKFFNSVVSGALVLAQPDYGDLTGVPATFAPTAHNLLSASHGDTTAAAVVRGDGVFAIGATPTWQRLAHPATTGGYFKWNGTDVVASSLAASGTGTPTACSNQFVTGLTLNADAAPTSTCTTATLASAQFANQGTTTTVLHGNAAGNPSFGAVVQGDVTNGYVDLSSVQSPGGDKTFSGSIRVTGNLTHSQSGGYTTDDNNGVDNEHGFQASRSDLTRIWRLSQRSSADSYGAYAFKLYSYDGVTFNDYWAADFTPRFRFVVPSYDKIHNDTIEADAYCTTFGTLDDSCITNAVAALTSGRSKIHVKAGTYAIANAITVTKQVQLIGDGEDATILQPTGGFSASGTVLTMNNSGGGSQEHYQLEGFSIDLANVNGANGVNLSALNRPHIERVSVKWGTSGTGTGFTLSTIAEVHFNRVYIKNPGVCINDNGDTSLEHYFTEVVCENKQQFGIKVTRTSSADVGAVYLTDVKMTNPGSRAGAVDYYFTSTAAGTGTPFFCTMCVGDNAIGLSATISADNATCASAGACWTSASVLTILATAHGMAVGQMVTLTNIAGGTCSPLPNGRYVIASVADANHFTVAGSGTSGQHCGAGTALLSADHVIIENMAGGTLSFINSWFANLTSNTFKNCAVRLKGVNNFKMSNTFIQSAWGEICYEGTDTNIELTGNDSEQAAAGASTHLLDDRFAAVSVTSWRYNANTANDTNFCLLASTSADCTGTLVNGVATDNTSGKRILVRGDGSFPQELTFQGVNPSQTNALKSIRLNSTGTMEWINNAHSIVLLSLADAGKLTPAAPTTTNASLNLQSGTAPTSPVNGDIWLDTNEEKHVVQTSTAGAVKTYDSGGTNAITDTVSGTVTSYTNNRPLVAKSGVQFGVNASNVITQNFSGDAGHAVSQTSKTAAVTTFTLCAATAGTACGQVGQYRISYNFWGSGTACSAVTAGSVGLNLTWTDENAVTHTTISMPMAFDQKSAAAGILFNFNTALGTEGASGSYIISTNGTIIQAATTYTACTTGTGTYNLRMTVEQLQ